MLKRALDIIIAVPALFILSLPLLMIAGAIVATDGRPAIFTQARVGRFGKPFTLYKFRTMHPDGRGLELTSRNDGRITAIGGWLRRRKLDELPQLFNILKGEMSFVGPRPEVPKYVAIYPREYERILTVRPGLTDAASIEFKNESLFLESTDPERIYIEQILPRKLELNLEYVNDHSLGGDLRLIFRTLAALAVEPKPALKKPVDQI